MHLQSLQHILCIALLTISFYVTNVDFEFLQERLADMTKSSINSALLLRFSLVGGMFDTIQRSTNLTTDWAVLLVQLVTYGVIDLNNNS